MSHCANDVLFCIYKIRNLYISWEINGWSRTHGLAALLTSQSTHGV